VDGDGDADAERGEDVASVDGVGGPVQCVGVGAGVRKCGWPLSTGAEVVVRGAVEPKSRPLAMIVSNNLDMGVLACVCQVHVQIRCVCRAAAGLHQARVRVQSPHAMQVCCWQVNES
jgi:hypothetical protein